MVAAAAGRGRAVIRARSTQARAVMCVIGGAEIVFIVGSSTTSGNRGRKFRRKWDSFEIRRIL
jgi:hypothetical protein